MGEKFYFFFLYFQNNITKLTPEAKYQSRKKILKKEEEKILSL